jgi:hypothetical protein
VSDENDPPRLSRGAGSDAERRLAALVSVSQSDVGSPEQVAALEARLLPLIGPPLAAPVGKVAATGKAAALGGAGAVKLAAAGAVVAAVASAVYFGAHGTSATQGGPAAATQQVAPAVHTEEPAVPVAPPEPAPAQPAPAPEVVGSAPVAPAPTGSHERAPSESELVGQAQAALSGNPARALALCDQHRRLYPRGVLVQEREVLAIEALQRLGRHSQAVARGERFLKAFPGSAHQSKIAAIVGSQ